MRAVGIGERFRTSIGRRPHSVYEPFQMPRGLGACRHGSTAPQGSFCRKLLLQPTEINVSCATEVPVANLSNKQQTKRLWFFERLESRNLDQPSLWFCVSRFPLPSLSCFRILSPD